MTAKRLTDEECDTIRDSAVGDSLLGDVPPGRALRHPDIAHRLREDGQMRAAHALGLSRGLQRAAEIAKEAADEVADMLKTCETSVHVGAVQRLASMVAAIPRLKETR